MKLQHSRKKGIYGILKEIVFWLSILGFILFASFIYNIRDELSIATITYRDNTSVHGNCDWIHALYENEAEDIQAASCDVVCERRQRQEELIDAGIPRAPNVVVYEPDPNQTNMFK